MQAEGFAPIKDPRPFYDVETGTAAAAEGTALASDQRAFRETARGLPQEP